MANWNNPTNTTDKTTLMAEIKDRDLSAAKMDYSADTNTPDDVIRFNEATPAFDKKNGGSWDQVFGAAQIDHDLLLNYDANEHPNKTTAQTISGTWTFSTGPKVSGLTFTSAATRVQADTSDGSDSKNLGISGGGAMDVSRGAYLQLFGNEGSSTGHALLFCGNVSGSKIQIGSQGAHETQIVRNALVHSRFTQLNSYPALIMGYDGGTNQNGIAMLGGDVEAVNSTTWVQLARFDLSASQSVSGVANFCGVRSGVDEGAGELLAFVAYKAAGSVVVSTTSLHSYVFGSSALEFRISSGSSAIYLEARLSTGTNAHKASVGVNFGMVTY